MWSAPTTSTIASTFGECIFMFSCDQTLKEKLVHTHSNGSSAATSRTSSRTTCRASACTRERATNPRGSRSSFRPFAELSRAPLNICGIQSSMQHTPSGTRDSDSNACAKDIRMITRTRTSPPISASLMFPTRFPTFLAFNVTCIPNFP